MFELTEKAMPFLRLEKATPTETDETIEELKLQLAERDKEMEVMKESFRKIQPLVDFVNTFNAPEDLKDMLNSLSDNMTVSSYDPNVLFDQQVAKRLDEIMKEKSVTQKQALELLVNETWKSVKESDRRRLEIAKAHGLPMTKEDYEKRRKKRKNPMARNNKNNCQNHIIELQKNPRSLAPAHSFIGCR